MEGNITLGGYADEALRPGRNGLRLELAVDVNGVHLLVEEAEQVLDLRTFRDRCRVGPDNVRELLTVDVDRPVGSLALVGATRHGARRRQQIESRVELGDVVA